MKGKFPACVCVFFFIVDLCLCSSWSHFLGIQRKEHNETIKRAILGRSLGVPGLSKKVDKSDSKLLKMTEDGDVVLLYEIIQGKLQVVAGTPEKLFEKLADESVQDMNYVDTYLSNHRSFITSIDLLDQLISRFYLTPLPGEYEYFSKWQTSIQTKVLNVIHQWITIQYQDFKCNTELERKLHSFLCSSSLKKYSHQVEKIEEHMNQGRNTDAGFLPFDSIDNKETVLPMGTPQPTSRRPSNSLFNFSTLSSLPIQLMDSSFIHQDVQNYFITPLSSFVSLESKDIARYLTLADFYLFKSILVNGFMSDHLPKHPTEIDHVQLMTKRANMLGHWVVHEICSLTYLKPKRTLLRKFIEIAKLCFELNNFHTCMVITMGLASAPKLKETWESLSSRDTNTFASLQKLLDVTMNMRYYRQKTQQAKSPAIPFLPVVLKDYTFLNENSTFLNAHPNLINFTKFTLLKQFTDKTADLLNEPYWFSNKLTVYPFFDKKQSHGETGSLNSIADWIETRLSQVQDCYLQCDLL
ncbi:ras guanine nucleotide exchange factor domain-containing protein [Gilbertella persicaria]|uniref:ras guanine nucleotide exchange factor domain-containing protein n=1 Tax=Gilbertella persicaria TaxID=101096 RepID=UPI00221E6807|nr:ras guanine nucleotide exchange factor domain-containing protein [Gilbertella persicaria]KAI8065324.1 ras guanine nucleotide exchange factor domain-containing protein [Gilbertella persicaria]